MQQTPFGDFTKRRLVAFLLLFAVLLRLFCIFNELWFDEILSLEIAASVKDPSQLWGVRFDNNHLLNTFYLLFVPPTSAFLVRFFAFLSGVFALFIAARLGILPLLLLSFSYPIILYSSEARGYATALAAALVAYSVFADALRGARSAIAFWYVSVFLGFLSHGSFIFFYCGVLTLSVFEVGKNRASIYKHLALHLPIAGLALSLWFYFYRFFPKGSGPRLQALEVLINTASVAFGGPELAASSDSVITGALVLATLALFLGFLEIGFLLKHSKKTAWFYLVVIFLAPLTFTLLLQPKVLFPRYFLISIGFYLLLLASLFERLYRRGKIGRAVAVSLTLIFIAGNLTQTVALLRNGRGEYRFLIDSQFEDPIFATDHILRHQEIINFYNRQSSVQRSTEIKFVGESPIPLDQARYYLTHTQDLFFEPPIEMKSATGKVYTLIRKTRTAPLSGWRIFVYESKSG